MAPERDIAAWLDRRDAEALGRVFDATGGKLLLLATHLASTGAQPQDLVQTTFLVAMARSSTWDRARLPAACRRGRRRAHDRSEGRREAGASSPSACSPPPGAGGRLATAARRSGRTAGRGAGLGPQAVLDAIRGRRAEPVTCEAEVIADQLTAVRVEMFPK